MAERAVADFQRGIQRWTSKGDNIRGSSGKIIQIRRFGGSKDFVKGLCEKLEIVA